MPRLSVSQAPVSRMLGVSLGLPLIWANIARCVLQRKWRSPGLRQCRAGAGDA